MDTMVPRIKNYTKTNYTEQDIAFAFHSHYIAGWGTDTQQVVVPAKLKCKIVNLKVG